uniref:Translocation protein SEC62 n=1 Tax=Mesocestoides corti TaxID=53468 RepID=A0A5K3EHV5_MESCO
MDAKKRRKLKNADSHNAALQPSPFELEVCKYLYRNLHSEEGRLAGCRVNFFYANAAIECLLQSPWAKVQSKDRDVKSPQFSNSDLAVRFMEKLVDKNLIGRAIKCKRKTQLKRKEDEKKVKARKNAESKDADKKEATSSATTSPSEKSATTTSTIKLKNEKASVTSGESYISFLFSSSSSTSAKRKKPVRLEYARDQIFVLNEAEGDNENVYIWVYEAPPSATTLFLGLALIIGVIVCCAFPMWPWQARQAAYYVTLAALALLGALLLLAAVRAVLYVVILVGSLGRVRLWIFPNFFADCGFIESFQPFYSFEVAVSTTSTPSQ